MASILFGCVPIHGHVSPLLALAAGFTERGDSVRFLTGSRFAAAVAATGAQHVALSGRADFDDRDVEKSFPERRGLSPIKAIAYDIEHVFVAPAEQQYLALQELIGAERPDVVIVDPTFAAGSLLVRRPRPERPPLVVAGVIPLPMGSRDVAPFGLGIAPLPGLLGPVRNRLLDLFTSATVLRRPNAVGRDIHQRLLGSAGPGPIMNWIRSADAVVQLSVASFEYPRSDAPAALTFVGPVATSAAAQYALPDWWSDLDDLRPIVHVTQGTIANSDLGELIRPTIEAFGGSSTQVVAATGGAPVADLGPLPSNAYAADFLPYAELLPRTDVFLTNGGYGGAQFALRYGVPIVVAPGQEDKTEVAARIAWSGVGINLRTEHPSPDRIRQAVERVLAEPRHRDAARRIGAEIAAAPGRAGFLAAVDRVIASPPV